MNSENNTTSANSDKDMAEQYLEHRNQFVSWVNNMMKRTRNSDEASDSSQ